MMHCASEHQIPLPVVGWRASTRERWIDPCPGRGDPESTIPVSRGQTNYGFLMFWGLGNVPTFRECRRHMDFGANEESVAELGCGLGKRSERAGRKGERVWGYDCLGERVIGARALGRQIIGGFIFRCYQRGYSINLCCFRHILR